MKKAGYIFLYPFSLVYGLCAAIRNLLFDWNIFKSRTFEEVKTISIGNLCAGGTGKTPHIEYLIDLLKEDFRLATLSRGYQRKTSGYLLATENSTAADIGDEPLQFKSKYSDILVAVDGDRVRGIKKLLQLNKMPEVILLDDAFQHRWVKPGLNILLTDYHNVFLHDTFLPSGRLRESTTGALRADIIIVTKTPEHATSVDIRGIMKDLGIRAYQSIYFSYLKYKDMYNFFRPAKKLSAALELYNYHVLILSGIASDKHLVTYIKEYAEDLVHKKFADHHEYTVEDVRNIRRAFDAIQAEKKLVITTEKDAMRLNTPELRAEMEGLPLFVLPVEVDFKGKTEEFNENIYKYVRANKIYHKKYM